MTAGRARRRELGKVLLVTPPYHCGMVESAGVWMPLGLAYVAGSLKQAGYQPIIYDAMSIGHGIAEIRDTIEDVAPDVVATTGYTASARAAASVLAAAKDLNPQTVTVMGGVHATHMPADCLLNPSVDYVVRGEGEETLPELLDCLSAGEEPRRVRGISWYNEGQGGINNPTRSLTRSLDSRPIAWENMDWPLYHYRVKPGSRLAVTSWSRGCTHKCSFCSQHKLWRGTWRARDPKAVVAEVRMLAERFGVDTLWVADEYPTCDRHRWEHILDRLIEENLGVELLVETRADDIVRDERFLHKYREAGILHMYVGVESVYQSRLDSVGKQLRVEDSLRAISLLNDLGIITETSFLLGFPDDTPATVEQTLELSHLFNPDLAFFLPVTPWPYSDLYRQVAGRIEVFDYSLYNLINPVFRPDAMSRQELSDMLARCFMGFYSRKMATLNRLPLHKQDYMKKVAGLLMHDSYLAPEVRECMRKARTQHGRPAPASSSGRHGYTGMPGNPDSMRKAG